ncbi:MAG: PKD domain-containing protein [Thermoplasmata archaeon]|nr:PKD domain-containing protein [Thermoplasmata archaeon]
MGLRATRAALWALVLLLLVGGLAASIPGAWASSTPTYTLTGWVEQPLTTAPVPAGVTVDLTSQATQTTFTALTQSSSGVASGQFTFSSSSTGNALTPGWWSVSVPAQARLHLVGCNPCAILPANPGPTSYLLNASALTSSSYPVYVPNVSVLPYTTQLFGNATNGGNPAVNASVQLLAPQYSSLVLANATTNRTGSFNFSAPAGSWVLRTLVPTSPSQFDFQWVNVSGTRMTVDPVINGYVVYGHVNQRTAPSAHVPNGGNATLIDLANMDLYSYPITPGGFYSVGTYPGNFSSGPENFDVVLSVLGYGTMYYPLTVNALPSGTPHDVLAPAIGTPSNYTTTLDFSRGFSNLSVNTSALLGNDSVFPQLPNASVGQLWTQLALDWSHNLTFSSADNGAVGAWIQSQGPFFPAPQAGASVNGVSFGVNNNFTYAYTPTCAGGCGLTSNAAITLGYQAKYNTSSTVSSGLKNYTLNFNYKHPSHAQAYNYTVKLPAGYVLSAGAAAAPPAGSRLVASGPAGTWTSFTLVSQPYSSASSSASLPIVKFGNVTAIVNVSVANFAFSQQNTLNQTRNNYTVIVGTGENVTFSAANSTFPSGTNGTLFKWAFGDSSTKSVPSVTTYHSYASAGKYAGTLMITSSGGGNSETNFTVYVGSSTPTARISVNSTLISANGVNYTLVNWSTTLHFNATTSTSSLGAGAPSGVVSVANWNVSAHSFYTRANYTASSGAHAKDANYTYTFTGAGLYLSTTTINGVTVNFLGWQYNVTLQLWDAGGHYATSKMVVLVRDTQKPVPVVSLLNSASKGITASGLIESASNHTAEVQLSAANSTDPNNGSLTWYNWTVTNPVDTAISGGKYDFNQSSLAGFKLPARPVYWLAPQSKAYVVNLTVTDRAGNHAYKTASVSVSVNVSLRPVLSVSNLTAPSTMTDGSSYTIWANVTNTLGTNSTAQNVSVLFYLLPPSGSGSPISLGGSPGSVQFFNYTTNTTIASAPFATGLAKLPYNVTVRAVMSFTPARTGTWDLWVNATASNEFVANYAQGANLAHTQVTINQNPLQLYEEYGAIALVAIVVIVAIVLYWRARGRPRSGGTSKSSGSGKSGGSDSKGRKDDEDDE